MALCEENDGCLLGLIIGSGEYWEQEFDNFERLLYFQNSCPKMIKFEFNGLAGIRSQSPIISMPLQLPLMQRKHVNFLSFYNMNVQAFHTNL